MDIGSLVRGTPDTLHPTGRYTFTLPSVDDAAALKLGDRFAFNFFRRQESTKTGIFFFIWEASRIRQ